MLVPPERTATRPNRLWGSTGSVKRITIRGVGGRRSRAVRRDGCHGDGRIIQHQRPQIVFFAVGADGSERNGPRTCRGIIGQEAEVAKRYAIETKRALGVGQIGKEKAGAGHRNNHVGGRCRSVGLHQTSQNRAGVGELDV